MAQEQDWFDQHAPKATTQKSGDDWFASNAPTADFTANEKGEGTYEMAGPGGKKVKIPYSMVGDASKAGYKMSDADRTRYVKDSANDPNVKDATAPEGVKVVGKNAAGQDIYAPEGPAPGSALSRFASAEGSAIGGAAKGLVKFLDPRASEEEKQRGQTSTFDILMRYPERLVQPHVDMMTQADEEAKAGNHSSALEHRLAAGVPLVGPWAASVIDQAGGQAAQGNIAGAAGTLTGNAMVAEAPGLGTKLVKGGAALVPRVGGSFVEAITKTGPREVKALAEHAEKENAESAAKTADINAKNADKHLGDTLDAVQEANKHANKEGFRSEVLDRQNEQKRQEFNKKELERVKAEGEARLEALKENKDKITDYEERRDRIKKENDRNYRREVRQQNLQGKLKTATTKLDDLYKKAFKDATSTYNTTWNKWRDQIKNAKANMSSTVDTIKAQSQSMNPQQVNLFRDILRETAPDANDMSEYETTRESVMKNLGYKGGYDELNPMNRKSVDDMMNSIVSLDKLSSEPTAAVKDIPATRLHGWKSQLERAVRTEKDGTIRYAIGKVLDTLRTEEQNVSASVGPDAVKQLTKARSITGPYFDAFYKQPEDMPPVAGKSFREQNPEFAREQAQAQRLERIAKYNPDLAPAAKVVANLKEGLENIAKEKNIGKRSELPVRPDLSAVPTVTPAGEYQPKEFSPTPGAKNIVVPDRPITEEAAKKTLSAEDFKKWKAENVAKASQRIRDLAISRAMYAGMTAIPVSIASFALGHPGAAALEISTPFAVVEFSNAVANLLEKPGVVEYLSRITDRDVEAFKKLPPEQQKIFKEDMTALTKEAEKQGVSVSPVFSAFLKSATATGAANAAKKKKPTPKELLEQAHNNLQSSMYGSGFGGIPPNAGARYSHTAVNDDGHQIGSNDGENWFDIHTGKKVA